jgi:uncharacterized protein with GYD domain
MATFVMLTRLGPGAIQAPSDLERLAQAVENRIRKDCPEVRWTANFAVLGPYDYLDVFEAPDEAVAAKVAMIVRFLGHAQTETWSALTWERYKKLISE